MSTHVDIKRITIPQITAMKGQQKIVCLTSYSAPFARILDEFVDLILIGDSTAMVGYNMENTLAITVEQMAAHGAAVMRSTQQAAVVVDMPFGSYQESKEQAFRNAAHILQHSNVQAVKMEGGAFLADTTRFLTERGIPVMAHVGLMPQYFNTMGGFKAQGLSEEMAERIYNDAIAQAQAGAFAIVIEGSAESLARRITENVNIPTIGIGASPQCDGQILVAEDILNLSGPRIPKFAKQFADVGAVIREGVKAYAEEVRGGTFPTLDHCFGVKKGLK
ncbi:3-methyl-2-oxobutanoate hydroxymethyltransferase [Pelistega europaea]|uniref:3-methyl-2-oxobutanoate hydroxymethyltransferase n=1 Tax=Pelistega europaea TaxID=106147 RepID=A0A7Y4P4C5_9BURK|nr:3-methyl-2-oxobutanoate hydroxymethyltransferase [Pelistega europaea]NOL48568.1 3-methyl-2-oxobutanoate hydroxymethyltransferase [Pelistega europaea]